MWFCPVTNALDLTGSQGAGVLAEYLQDRGYPKPTRQVYVQCVNHFAEWLDGQSNPPHSIEETIEEFLRDHLPGCQCPGPRQRGRRAVRAALGHLRCALREQGLVEEAPTSLPGTVHEELDSFSDYLRKVGGLAAATVVSRRQWTCRFLRHCFASESFDRRALDVALIHDFFRADCTGLKPGTMQVIGSSLRSYFRFRCVVRGESVERLLAAVPTIAQWRLANVPERLSPHDIHQWLESFDPGNPQGKRDYAMALCLVDLGLRACEVAHLRLEDMDWGTATITIEGGKSRRADQLPLPASTGRAIADYLHEGRSRTPSRMLFVRHRAPFDIPVTASLVRGVMYRAWLRSGLPGPWRGPHVLRHTAATRWLGAGASLKQIADLLRHRSLDTTMIYAKVDFTRLAQLVQPWPGGAQ